jgi:hypothetical protein
MEVGLWTMAIGARLLKVALLTMLLVGCEFRVSARFRGRVTAGSITARA